MSKRADRLREQAWKDAGNARLTVRITAAADRILDSLASQHHCSRRDVIEGLLFGNIKRQAELTSHAAVVERERRELRMSKEEHKFYRAGSP